MQKLLKKSLLATLITTTAISFALTSCSGSKSKEEIDLLSFLPKESSMVASLDWRAKGTSEFLSSKYVNELMESASKAAAASTKNDTQVEEVNQIIKEIARPNRAAFSLLFPDTDLSKAQVSVITEMKDQGEVSRSRNAIKKIAEKDGQVFEDSAERLSFKLDKGEKSSRFNLITSGNLILLANSAITSQSLTPQPEENSFLSSELYKQSTETRKRDHSSEFVWFCLNNKRFVEALKEQQVVQNQVKNASQITDFATVNVGTVNLSKSLKLAVTTIGGRSGSNLAPRGSVQLIEDIVPSSHAVWFALDGKLIDEIFLGAKDAMGDSASAINELQSILADIKELGIGVSAPLPGSLAPEMFILAGSKDNKLSVTIESELKNIGDSFGVPLGDWQTREIEGTKTRFLITPLNVGIFMAETDGKLIVTLSESGMRTILKNKKNASSTNKDGTFAGLGVNFSNLADLIEAVQGTAAMFAGGQGAGLENLEDLRKIGTLKAKQRVADSNFNAISEIELNPPQ